MGVCIIAVTMRPEQSGHLRRAIERQTPSVSAVVVVNGRCHPGAHAETSADVLRGPMHKAACLEMGRIWAKNRGFEAYVTMDDDDYYSHNYVAHMRHALFASDHSWVGQPDRYMRTTSDRLWRVVGAAGGALGGCLAARVGLSWARVPNVIAPEVVFSHEHGPPGVVPIGHYAHVRRAGVAHVWPASDEHIANGLALDLGSWDPGVVDGVRPVPLGTPVTARDPWMDDIELLNRQIAGVPSEETSWQ